MSTDDRRTELRDLASEVRELRDAMVSATDAQRSAIDATHPRHRRSAENLVQYVELRRRDIRPLQGRLAALGLSSLGRTESHALASVEAVLGVLDALAGNPPSASVAPLSIAEGAARLAENAERTLGPQPPGRLPRIMVTMPSEAADSPALIEELVAAGMDVARINCAHDDATAWVQMIEHLRERERPPLVAMDLAGPKLRTVLGDGPSVVRVKPTRDEFGRVTSPALVRLRGRGATTPPASADDDGVPTLHVDDDAWLQRRRPGDAIELIDARGSRRQWTVTSERGADRVIESNKTSYLTNGIELTSPSDPLDDVAMLCGIEPIASRHRIVPGDRIVLARDIAATTVSAGDDDSDVVIGCTLPELFGAVSVGEPVWFDDGKIGGVAIRATRDAIVVEVDDVAPGGANLRDAKGINVPATDLPVAALTAKDLEDLDVIAANADLVNLSFVRRPDDVWDLQARLHERGADQIGIVLKIENVRSFENLPRLLLAAMASERVGVMIARGDLAVEVGFERMAELQEEILWACEAAHVPVIWATQVLETLAKTGRPSRAEVTDAAMSVRAECVMLNKGPYIVEAITSLDSILTRMSDHHRKKHSLLRRLRSWDLDDEPVEASAAFPG